MYMQKEKKNAPPNKVTLKGALEKERRSKRKKGDIRVTERDSMRYETREERM